MSRWTVDLPFPPRELSPNARSHWAKKSKAAKAYRQQCRVLLMAEATNQGWDVPALIAQADGQKGGIHLWIDFYPPDRRHRDDDNCAAAFKAGRDGLADALEIDDRMMRMHPFLHAEPVKGGLVRVTITGGPQK